MKKIKIGATRAYTVGAVQDRMFSSFVEHMGSCVYNGIYEPGHPKADENGFRGDVAELARELRLAAVRYPGGNYTSGYNWEDSVGRRRPARLDLAWKQVEPNTFGLHEFTHWLELVGPVLIMTVNLGTRGADEARALLEYCNFPGGTAYSDLRRENGVEKPMGIRTWCLGNELDGTWQIGHKTAEEYGRLAAETARIMRMFDRNLELIAVGSSHGKMDTFPEWDRKVLMECYDDVDYIALHKYVGKQGRDTAAYLASPMEMERQIREVVATCDYVRSVKRSPKVMKLSFDEWNVASNPQMPDPKPDWQVGPDRDKFLYKMEDMLVFASMMLTLLRNADRVHIACQAILVNVIPMIVANKGGGAFRNTIFYPFLHGSLYGRGQVLHTVEEDMPLYDCGEFTDVPVVDTVAVYDEKVGAVTLFAVNRSPGPQVAELSLNGFGKVSGGTHLFLQGDLTARNTEEAPTACTPGEKPLDAPDKNTVSAQLAGYSWNVIRIKVG